MSSFSLSSGSSSYGPIRTNSRETPGQKRVREKEERTLNILERSQAANEYRKIRKAKLYATQKKDERMKKNLEKLEEKHYMKNKRVIKKL